MNNYVAMSSHYYYQRRRAPTIRDQRNFLAAYQQPPLNSSGFGGLLAYGLSAIGMPASIVNVGYRFGYFMDTHAVH
jgi:hypothetical protein